MEFASRSKFSSQSACSRGTRTGMVRGRAPMACCCAVAGAMVGTEELGCLSAVVEQRLGPRMAMENTARL